MKEEKELSFKQKLSIQYKSSIHNDFFKEKKAHFKEWEEIEKERTHKRTKTRKILSDVQLMFHLWMSICKKDNKFLNDAYKHENYFHNLNVRLKSIKSKSCLQYLFTFAKIKILYIRTV